MSQLILLVLMSRPNNETSGQSDFYNLLLWSVEVDL